MALPAYDPAKHHIGLGPSETELSGFMLAAAYSRTGQNFGAPQDFGAHADLIEAPALSRWSMDDFSGGVGRRTWGADPRMFSDSLNLVPTKFDKTLRTVPPIVDFAKFPVAGEIPLWAGAAAGYLFCVFKNGVHRWDPVTGARVQVVSGLGTSAANTPRGVALDRNSNILLILFDSGVINRYSLPDGTTASSWSPTGAIVPAGAQGEGINASGAAIVFAVSGYLYGLTVPNSGPVSDSNFLKIGRLPGVWVDSCVYNGIVYILVSNKDAAPMLLQWSGATSLLPVTELPYNFVPEKVAVYGGRVYVGGAGRDFSDKGRYGMLFEVTGASLRLVRSFKPELGPPNTTIVKSIHDLAVYEGLLLMGDTGRCLATYDVTTDSFTGGSQLLPPDGVRQIRKIVPFRDTVFTWLTHPLDQAQDGWYKVIVPGETSTAPFEGVFISSDFALEPDRDKRWSQIRVLTRGGPCTVGYSLEGGAPGGDTFVELDQVTQLTKQHGDLYTTTFDLSEIPTSPAVRFRIRMPRGQNPAGSTELVAFTASFAFLDTGKWAWHFTVNGTERVELRDGTTLKQDVSDVGSELRRFWVDKVPLVYNDVDGASYRVQLTTYQESQPAIGPRSHYQDPVTLAEDEAQEAFYAVQLLEV